MSDAVIIEFPQPERPLAKTFAKVLVATAHRQIAFHQAVATHHFNEALKIQAQLNELEDPTPKEPA